jgi:proteasome assembly chaperone (PAC2) family protein
VRDPLELQVRPDLREAALLLAFEGWNDAGEAASSAVRFIERSIRAVPLAEIDCEEFLDFTVARPNVRLAKGESREIEWPHTRFAYGAVDPCRELVVCCGTEPHVRWRAYADACVRLVRTLGLRRVVLLGAYLADVLYSRPVGVTGFASRPELLEALGVTRSSYEGPTGIVGVLGEAFRREGLEVVSLWATLPHYISAAPNPRGALALVQKAMQLLDLKLDTEGLERDAAGFEERISAVVAADPELAEYVRQLKKREFAQ